MTCFRHDYENYLKGESPKACYVMHDVILPSVEIQNVANPQLEHTTLSQRFALLASVALNEITIKLDYFGKRKCHSTACITVTCNIEG